MASRSTPLDGGIDSSRRLDGVLGLAVLVLLLAAGMRVLGTADRPAWTDEGWSVWAASDPGFSAIVDKVKDDHHPPLYFAALGRWRSVAGDSRIALRFPAIAAGLLTTTLVFRIGADWFGQTTGSYGALLYAVLGIAVYYAQEIRHYSWLMLATSLMSLFFLRYLRRPRPAWFVLYALSVAFMLGTLYVGVLLLAVQAMIGLLLWRREWRARVGLVGAWLAALLVLLPWWQIVPDQITQVQNTAGVPGAYRITLQNVLILADFLLGNQLALMAGLYLVGVWGILRRSNWRRMPALAQVHITLAGGGLFVVMCLLNARVGTLTLRTLVFLTPMVMVICAYGLSQLERPARAVFAVVAVFTLLARADEVQPRLDYASAARTLAAQYTPGDLVILETGFDDNAFQYELSLAVPDDAPPIIRTLPWVDHGRPDRHRPVVAQVEDFLQAHRRVWIVHWLQPTVLIPFLDAGNYGFQRVLTQKTPTGARYLELYPDHPAVEAVLYERPELERQPLTFGDLLVLRDALVPASLPAGGTLHVDLWWMAVEPPALDYSVGVYLMPADGDTVLAQHDGPPGALPTSQWTPDTLVFDRHTLTLPATLQAGVYRVVVGVYWHGDRQPLLSGDRPYVSVGQIEVRR